MSVILKFPRSLYEIKKEWEEHQIKRDPHFLTRRQFLGQGAAGVTALTFMPSIFSLLTQSSVVRGATSFNQAAVVLSLRGGYSHAAEAIPVDISGNFLTAASYQNLGRPGIDPSNSPGSVSTQFGYPLWTQGRLFQALNNASSAVKNNVSVVAGWHSNSQDDSTSNPNMPGQQLLASVAKAGGNFRVMGTQVGSNTTAGGNGQPTAMEPGFQPVQASTLGQAQNLLTLKQGGFSGMSDSAVVAAANLAQAFSASAKARFQAMAGGTQLQEAVQSTSGDFAKNVASTGVLDPRTDPKISAAFGITSATAVTDPRVAIAASAQLVAQGKSPFMVAQLNANFDYHDGTPNWNAANGPHDLVAKTLVSLLESFAANQKSVIVMLATDGATGFANTVTGTNTDPAATGDKAPIHGVMYVVLRMNGEAPVQQNFLGGMRSGSQGGTADTSAANLLGQDPSYEGQALVASLLGMAGLDPSAYAVGTTPAQNLAALNIFSKKT
jgi:hypothetical protein